MTRRELLKGLIGASTIAITGCSKENSDTRQTADSSIPKDNIVIIVADDLGYGDLSCYGNPVIQTPNLDKLASEGIKLNQCYTPSPNCSPARAGMMTGRHPYRSGIYDFLRPESSMYLKESEPTIPKMLKDLGYETAHIGKWHISRPENNPEATTPEQLGFNYKSPHIPKEKAHERSVLVTNQAISWITDKWSMNNPMCLFVWYWAPHEPVSALNRYLSMYRNVDDQAEKLRFGEVPRPRADGSQKHKYFGALTQLDNEIGRLLDMIDTLGLKKDTFVFFTSDNGPEHRAPHSFGSPGNLYGAKGWVYEGGIRVPGIVRYPKTLPQGVQNDIPNNATDLLPTISHIVGIDPPSEITLDGTNIMGALKEQAPPERDKPLFWWLFHARGDKQVAMRVNRWKILASMSPEGEESATGFGHKPPYKPWMDYIKEAGLTDYSLHNLEEDPKEQTDVSQENPKQFSEMQEKLNTIYQEIQTEGPRWSNLKW